LRGGYGLPMPESCSTPAGRELKARLVLAGLRVPDVAAELGMSPDTLYRVLRDERVLTTTERDGFDAIVTAAEVKS
jgi:AcrR family transcriptional regulator